MEGPTVVRLTESEDGGPQSGAPAPVVDTPNDDAVVLSEATSGKGNVFDVLVIQPGRSKNRRQYRPEVLRDAAPLLEGARSFASDGPDHDPRKRGVKALVGWWSEPRYQTGVELPGGKTAEGIVARYHVTDRDLAETLRESLEGGKPDLITFSIVADGEVRRVREAGGSFVSDVTRITAFESVDPVINAAAGGMAVRLVASVEDPSMDWAKLTLAEAVKGLADGTIAAEDVKANRADLHATIFEGRIVEAVPAAPAPAAPAAPAPAAVDPAEVRRLVEAELAPIRTARLVEAALSEHPKLPERVKARIRSLTEGKALTEAEVKDIVDTEVKYLSDIAPAVVSDSGSAKVTDMKSERERVTEAMYDILAGKSQDSIKAMYVDLTGDRAFTGRMQESGRLTESIASTTFADILGDSVTRRMLDIYSLPELGAWRNIVSIVPLNDFRTQHRTRMGGYGNLPAVSQGAAYAALTSPGDEDATYAATKRGGTEDITMETIVNDDLGAIRQVPVRLGRAAAQTLHEFAFDFLATNPTIYDAVALFHATHANLGSAALDATTLTAGRNAMRKQTDMSSSKRLAIVPKFLVVPIDLEQSAYELTATDREVASANNTLNFVKTFGLTVIVVDYWTDANNWFLSADPSMAPTIEVGFLNGKQEPELFLQDMPNVGSVFSNDKLTYKVRHIYGGGVVDYRGLYGAVVA